MHTPQSTLVLRPFLSVTIIEHALQIATLARPLVEAIQRTRPAPRFASASCRRLPKSTSLTLRLAHSISRKPAPYRSDAISRGSPSSAERSRETSSRVRTTGSRLGRFAITKFSIDSSSLPSTSEYRNRIAASAWFWVDALTASAVARLVRKDSTARAPSSDG